MLTESSTNVLTVMRTDICLKKVLCEENMKQEKRLTWQVLCLTAIAVAGIALMSCREKIVPISADDEKFQEELQTRLIEASSGETIALPEGTFRLDRGLSLTVDNVTIRGAGMDKTILDFSGQTQGSEGLLVTGNDFTLEDLTIQNTKGDGLKVNGADGVYIRRVKAEWTGGPSSNNGAYGLYPVQCENVLIEDSVAIAASDAGIYVGQSNNIIVRRNRAEFNVAGIEIENSTFADVYENEVTNNTGGILIFDLPDLPIQGGQNTRVFKNEVYENNTGNFAPSGNIVGLVPAGTGIMVMANDNVEVFENNIRDNQTVNMAIVSFYIAQRPINDESYDPYPEAIYVHNNSFSGGGDSPTGLLIRALSLRLGTPFPDVLHDGIYNEENLVDGELPDDRRICVQDNGDITVANIDAENNFRNINRDPEQYNCSLPRLQGISIPGI